MHGQWIGKLNGTNVGQVMLDLDDCGTHYEGHAFAFDDDPTNASSLAYVRTPNKNLEQTIQVRVLPMDAVQGALLNPQQLAATFPDVTFPESAELTFNVAGGVYPGARMDVTWRSSVGTNGTAQLALSRAELGSAYAAQINIHSWDEFKAHVLAQPAGKYIYRGQSHRKHLRTSFHRTHRKDLIRYLVQDLPAVRKALINRFGADFNYAQPEQYGALLALMQHHGFPTPMLDWTYSPFVAAYFAFEPFARGAPADEMVRIFALDKERWEAMPQYTTLSMRRPHLSLVEPLFLFNPRGVPQQSILSITNVDDIEEYIFLADRVHSHRYLYMFDIPASDAKRAIRELHLMGINAGSLFPGLDGECRALKSKFFDLSI